MMVLLEGKSSVEVRLGVSGCCTSGRNFLFVGCAYILDGVEGRG